MILYSSFYMSATDLKPDLKYEISLRRPPVSSILIVTVVSVHGIA